MEIAQHSVNHVPDSSNILSASTSNWATVRFAPSLEPLQFRSYTLYFLPQMLSFLSQEEQNQYWSIEDLIGVLKHNLRFGSESTSKHMIAADIEALELQKLKILEVASLRIIGSTGLAEPQVCYINCGNK